jgi:hypothetical protein
MGLRKRLESSTKDRSMLQDALTELPIAYGPSISVEIVKTTRQWSTLSVLPPRIFPFSMAYCKPYQFINTNVGCTHSSPDRLKFHTKIFDSLSFAMVAHSLGVFGDRFSRHLVN